jgi:hypothetical protein
MSNQCRQRLQSIMTLCSYGADHCLNARYDDALVAYNVFWLDSEVLLIIAWTESVLRYGFPS